MGGPRHLDVIEGPLAGEEVIDPSLAFEMSLADDLSDEPARDRPASLHGVVGVRTDAGRVVDHDAGDAVYRVGARVVCESPSGRGFGVVVVASRRTLAEGPLPRVLGPATDAALASEAALREREQRVFRAAHAVAAELAPDAKVVRAEARAEGQRFVVFVAGEQKLPFRDLVIRVGEATGERLEVQQVGLRDAAKVVGGVGPCGLQLCCNTFLSDFAPVTIKMAKDQGLGVNPQKLSGLCGRLFCCLVYEEAYYRAQRQLVPRPGDRVGSPRGEGEVREVDVLRMRVKLALAHGEVVVVPVAEITRNEPPGQS